MLALAELERDTGSHGELISEATNTAADPNNYNGGYHYIGHPAGINWATKTVEDAQDAYRLLLGDRPMPNGLLWLVEKVLD